jgi:hypothetical protein
MGKRPRVTASRELIEKVVVDELEFTNNIGSKNARKIIDKSEQIHVEIWYDKHYANRVQFGDNNGKRSGIEENRIQELVSKSLTHLIYYSFRVKNFVFVSRRKHNTISPRIVLQQDTNEGILNVVVGFCHITSNKYEVTVYSNGCKRFQNWRWPVFRYGRSRLFYTL